MYEGRSFPVVDRLKVKELAAIMRDVPNHPGLLTGWIVTVQVA